MTYPAGYAGRTRGRFGPQMRPGRRPGPRFSGPARTAFSPVGTEGILSFLSFAGIRATGSAPGAAGTRPGAHNRVSHSTEIETRNAREKGVSK